MRVAVLTVVLASWPAAALADVIGPPPNDCPDGTMAFACHGQDGCLVLDCASAPCGPGTLCASRSFCTETVTCYMGPTVTSAHSTCDAPGACAGGGTCTSAHVCVPYPSGTDATTSLDSATSDDAASIDAARASVDAADSTDASDGRELLSGCGCTTHRRTTGLALAAVALAVVGAFTLRRSDRRA